MAARIDLTTPAGQINYTKQIQTELTIRSKWMAQYGPEEYRIAPRMVKVRKQSAPPPEPAAAPAAEPAPVRAPPPATYQEVLKCMRFSTNTRDDFVDMADTPLHNLAKQSIQFGQFNRRKSLNEL